MASTSPHNQPRMSSSSSSDTDTESRGRNRSLQRPKIGTRKSSGTIIVPREHPRVELKEGDEVFGEDDARAMSPRRSSQDLEKMSQEARAQLNEYVPPSRKGGSGQEMRATHRGCCCVENYRGRH